ncbi:Zim17-type zinc finger protein [Striga asiatica]|uniref:Zim17-type zinc finger protein n=1 Tax=Striga asiatica TaxID=4170 RepID=A0A5A7PU95_STRAF|nr:Zim17-type zinc finger protein [Striga asiatica]
MAAIGKFSLRAAITPPSPLTREGIKLLALVISFVSCYSVFGMMSGVEIDRNLNAKHETPSLNTSPCLDNNQATSIKLNMNSNLKVSEKHDLGILISCKVCEARSFKTMARDSYQKGVVIAKCDPCGNLHLIADRLGLFGEEIKTSPCFTVNLTLKETRKTTKKKTEGKTKDIAGNKET